MELVRQKMRETKAVHLLGGVYISMNLGAVSGPQALEGMRSTLRDRVPSLGGNPWLFVGLLFIAMVSAGIIFKRKISRTEGEHKKLREKGFGPDEIQVLDQLARHHARLSAVELIEDESAFDAAAEGHLEALNDPEKISQTGADIISVRRKLDYDGPPDFRHYGTFALTAGETIRAVIERDQGSESFWLRVLDSEKTDLCLAGEKFHKIASEGEELDFYVLGDGSRLRGTTRVVEVDREGEVCHVAHSSQWENADRRRSHRVGVRGPVKCRTEEGAIEGRLNDLSAHGASLVRVEGLEEDDSVTVVLSPEGYLGPASAQNHPDTMEVPGVVLASRKSESGKLYPVEFDEMEQAERQPLYHLVQDIEVHQNRD